MQTREKIGTVILIVLIIILIIFIWSGQTAKPKIAINCQTACHKIGNMGWTFPTAGSIAKNIFSTKNNCISACQARIK